MSISLGFDLLELRRQMKQICQEDYPLKKYGNTFSFLFNGVDVETTGLTIYLAHPLNRSNLTCDTM